MDKYWRMPLAKSLFQKPILTLNGKRGKEKRSTNIVNVLGVAYIVCTWWETPLRFSMCMSISKGLLTPLGVSGLLWAFLDAFVYLETLLCFFAEEQMNGRTDGRTDGRAGRRTDRRTDERTSGRTGGCAKVSKALQGTTLFTIDKCSTVTQG